jgi:predicted TIM-barrel fold metal-dependent hydrolase
MRKVLIIIAITVTVAGCCSRQENGTESAISPEGLLLKDYAPVSVFNIQETNVEKAKFPVIDSHSHDFATNKADVVAWVEAMDAAGVEATNIMSCNWIGQPLDSIIEKYADYPDRFRFWCSFDYTDFDKPDWEERALASLQRYHDMGIVGVGEMGDKGLGDLYGYPVEGRGVHLDNPHLKVLLEKCGELGMPINIHIADPIWMYEPADASNDGLMNGYTWQIDTFAPECLDYDGLMRSFENAVAANPGTTFIACHYLNMTHDLPRLALLLDKYPNMYVDLAARIPETATIPRAMRKFMINYADRILFGTDVGMQVAMYRNQYRILETDDEHIYFPDYNNYGYHWSYSGFYLPDDVLEKIYRGNAVKLFGK